jgi:hypothetical protein
MLQESWVALIAHWVNTTTMTDRQYVKSVLQVLLETTLDSRSVTHVLREGFKLILVLKTVPHVLKVNTMMKLELCNVNNVAQVRKGTLLGSLTALTVRLELLNLQRVKRSVCHVSLDLLKRILDKSLVMPVLPVTSLLRTIP